MSLRLYLLRHGETAWSLSGQHTGRADISLTRNGESEARQLGERIRPISFAHVFCSPLVRAIQTCELVGLSKSMLIDHDLAEWDNGDYEGKTRAEIFALCPNWNIFRDGCPNGEMPTDIAKRADRLVARFSELDGNVAIVAHSHLGRVLAARWIGLAVEFAECFLLNTASMSILSIDLEHGKPGSLMLWNSTLQNSLPNASLKVSKSLSKMKLRALECWENEGGRQEDEAMVVSATVVPSIPRLTQTLS
jgi:broad specificity phosphatase PhoE